jgi:hypothetical protein
MPVKMARSDPRLSVRVTRAATRAGIGDYTEAQHARRLRAGVLGAYEWRRNIVGCRSAQSE